MKFIAIDVETANANMASICSIGAAMFENGALKDEFYTLIDPNDYFDPTNVSIHGIEENDVRGAPTFKDMAAKIDDLFGGQIVVTHTHFDRVAIQQASSRWSVTTPKCTWLDSARVARRTWAECARSGYGLAEVSKRIGYTFEHHNALEDAKASGQIMIAAMRESGLDLEAMLKRVLQPIGPSSSGPVRRDGNPDGPLSGEVVVLTGTFSVLKSELADVAASLGCEVADGVTKKTTILIVGDVDVDRLAGHEKTAKHRKAEDLVIQGRPIRILRESDFRELVATVQ
jgi:DNA polymerase III subunit epsilon